MKMCCSFFLPLILALALTGLAQADSYAPDGSIWTRVNDDEASATYSPNMRTYAQDGYYNGDMHDSSNAGEWSTFQFNGTGVKWIGGRNNDHGQADVYLDGKLDTTVDSHSSSWLKQQELYVKSGLTNGPHTLKIVVKTGGYQDFDAFEFLAPPPAPPPPEKIGATVLPDQVPYLNTPHRYPVGSGLAMAVGDAVGGWTRLFGPGYTSSNQINWESLTLEVDGVEEPLSVEMKRARETGIFYGTRMYGDLRVYLIDYTCAGAPWISRLVLIDNTSSTTSHDVRVRALIKPLLGLGRTQDFLRDASHVRCGLALNADTTVAQTWAVGNNLTTKAVVISFTDPATTAFRTGETYTLETGTSAVPAGSSFQVALCHYFRQDAKSDSQYVDLIRGMNSVDDLARSITDWHGWFEHVGATYQLTKITEPRARDMVEGGLAILKTNQSQDGGIIAHSTWYIEGYIRDAALGLRGLTATGHFDESKQWLLWVHSRLSSAGHLPDYFTCEPSLAVQAAAFDMGNRNVEEPALYLLAARDYYQGTGDIQTLNTVRKTLQFCMDVQLKDAMTNGNKLEFNGDETEVCGAADIRSTGTDGGTTVQQNAWSLSSVAECAAALQFYIHYLEVVGEDPTAYLNSQTGTKMNLKAELAGLTAAMDTDFWRTDVPEIPGGFHDWFRKKSDNSWPLKRVVNFTLMPVYFGAPYANPDRRAKDVEAIASYFDEKTGFLQLVPGADTGFDGHDLGYLLWDLVEIGSPKKEAVYHALVNGPTADCWGSFTEGYNSAGAPNDHDLRTLETGCNVSALAKYWGLGP